MSAIFDGRQFSTSVKVKVSPSDSSWRRKASIFGGGGLTNLGFGLVFGMTDPCTCVVFADLVFLSELEGLDEAARKRVWLLGAKRSDTSGSLGIVGCCSASAFRNAVGCSTPESNWVTNAPETHREL